MDEIRCLWISTNLAYAGGKIMGESICTGCGFIRPVSSFYNKRKWKCGVCKQCRESVFSSVDRWWMSLDTCGPISISRGQEYNDG